MPRQPVRRVPKGATDDRCQIPLRAMTRPEEDEIEAENGAESRRPFVLEGAFFMKRDIRERLKTDVLLADGAMGTLLVSRGAPAEGPRSPNLRRRARPRARDPRRLRRRPARRCFPTNTWDANRAKLSKFDWADSLEKINRAAVRLARAAAEGEYVYVAGSVGPLGQLVKPYGPLTQAPGARALHGADPDPPRGEASTSCPSRRSPRRSRPSRRCARRAPSRTGSRSSPR